VYFSSVLPTSRSGGTIVHPVHWSVLPNELMDTNYLERFHVHEYVLRDIIVKITNEMQLCMLIYYSKSALHASGDVLDRKSVV
jgi:hypothetical protein